jgi:hypothetical protein
MFVEITATNNFLKEDFQNLWEYKYSASVAKFLDQWCTRTMLSKIEPMLRQKFNS